MKHSPHVALALKKKNTDKRGQVLSFEPSCVQFGPSSMWLPPIHETEGVLGKMPFASEDDVKHGKNRNS